MGMKRLVAVAAKTVMPSAPAVREAESTAQTTTPATPASVGRALHPLCQCGKALPPRRVVEEEEAEDCGGVTTPSEIIPYYRLNHSIWSLSNNKESFR
jgi:hypothetical protein